MSPPLNQAASTLPPYCDVLVLGAGPAGSACAKWLAAAGRHVVLVDAQRFPRDKTCGDGLVPDTHAALRRLGVLDAVLAQARRAATARCVAPNGRSIDVPGELAALPRRKLDTLLCQAAVEAGAHMVAPVRFESLLRDAQGRVIGAQLRSSTDGSHEVLADWVVLATGASLKPLEASGLCQRRTPTGMAIRGYVRHPGMAAEIPGLRFFWHPTLKQGYGWIFPGPDHTYNIGTGVLKSLDADPVGPAPKARNLRAMFADFVAADPVAAKLVREGEMLGDLKGAPLRCDLNGARWSSPGLLAVGDAIGATYGFSGEGIGKALETGIAAAEALLTDPAQDSQGNAAVQAQFHARLEALRPQFNLYRKAASVNQHPWLLNLLIWRAQHSPRIISRLADILAERRPPGSLLSWRGLKRLILG
ncbi:MAG: geranylgeranyl reductase [Ideonella sp. MAG2]|nr:MAG: geranylgeranyl reductase [Ideonella sp. MAG2]